MCVCVCVCVWRAPIYSCVCVVVCKRGCVPCVWHVRTRSCRCGVCGCGVGAGCGVGPCALCVCTCIGVCARARAHVFTLPETTSFLGLPSLHPEVFNGPSTQLNKTKQRDRAGLRGLCARGAGCRESGRSPPGLPEAGARLPATGRLLAPLRCSRHSPGLRDTRHPPLAAGGGKFPTK